MEAIPGKVPTLPFRSITLEGESFATIKAIVLSSDFAIPVHEKIL